MTESKEVPLLERLSEAERNKLKKYYAELLTRTQELYGPIIGLATADTACLTIAQTLLTLNPAIRGSLELPNSPQIAKSVPSLNTETSESSGSGSFSFGSIDAREDRNGIVRN